jgi:hypothetical protein
MIRGLLKSIDEYLDINEDKRLINIEKKKTSKLTNSNKLIILIDNKNDNSLLKSIDE